MMSVSREKLYEEVWTEAMTTVAKRYGVSSNFLGRVCERLNVPRPPRGYWAQVQSGRHPPQPKLPAARPGDEISWARGYERREFESAVPKLPEMTKEAKRRRPKSIPDVHDLIATARPVFEAATLTEYGYPRPTKRQLVDVFVTKALLPRAFETANALFRALEIRGHRVMLAPNASRLARLEVNVRSDGGQPGYDFRYWKPYSATVVYVDSVAIGLSLYELTEQAVARHMNGKYVRVADLPASRNRRYEPWTTTHDFVTGKLCLRAYSPHGGTKWQNEWRESGDAVLANKISRIVKELEEAVHPIVAQVTEAERLAAIERQKWEAHHEAWLRQEEIRAREEAERRRLQKIRESREQLIGIAETWERAIHQTAFFSDVERLAQELDDADRAIVLQRLARARELVGETDALQLLRGWLTPEEREAPLNIPVPAFRGAVSIWYERVQGPLPRRATP